MNELGIISFILFILPFSAINASKVVVNDKPEEINVCVINGFHPDSVKKLHPSDIYYLENPNAVLVPLMLKTTDSMHKLGKITFNQDNSATEEGKNITYPQNSFCFFSNDATPSNGRFDTEFYTFAPEDVAQPKSMCETEKTSIWIYLGYVAMVVLGVGFVILIVYLWKKCYLSTPQINS